MNHRKSDMLDAVKERLNMGPIELGFPPFGPELVIVDLLQFLNLVPYYIRSAHNNELGNIRIGDIVQQVQTYLSKQISKIHGTTTPVRRIWCTIDFDDDVPITKGPTQRARKQTGIYVEPYERKLEINRNTQALASFNKHQGAKHEKERQFATFRQTPSIFDLEDRVALAMRLGILPPDHDPTMPLNLEQTIALLDVVCDFEVPLTFFDRLIAGASGYRRHFIPFLIQSLVFLEQFHLSMSPNQEVIICGHYCTKEFLGIEAMHWGSGESVSNEEFIRMPLKLRNNGELDVLFQVCQLGEADYQMMYAIVHEQTAEPSRRLVVQCITSDSDAVWHALWLLTKYQYSMAFGESLLPQIYINTKKKIEGRATELFFDINEMHKQILQLIPTASTYERNPPSNVEMFSFLTMVAAFASDYTIGYSYITAQTMLQAYLEYRFGRIGMLVRIHPGNVVVPDEEAYILLVLCCYYQKYPNKLNMDGSKECDLQNLKRFTIEYAIRRLQSNVGERYKSFFNEGLDAALHGRADVDVSFIERWIRTLDLDQFTRFVSATNRRMPPKIEIFRRFQLLSYYVCMMNGIGHHTLVLPHPLQAGYRLIDSLEPLSRDNIAFEVDDDYDGFKRIRRELIAARAIA